MTHGKGQGISGFDRPQTLAGSGSDVFLTSEADRTEGTALGELAFRADRVRGSADAAIALALGLGSRAPLPGDGNTARRWELLATLAAVDLTAARVAEAHLDALAIIAEAGLDANLDLTQVGAGAGSTWGVFAAEGPGVKVQAEPIQFDGREHWHLIGLKPWCSLAGQLSHALITAHTTAGHRRLFAVSLRTPEVQPGDGQWVSRGLRQVVSSPIELRGAVGVPIGADEWYLRRSGFAWGGAGVAACWYGGAVGLARTLYAKLSEREPDQIGLMHLGALDLRLSAARWALAAAARSIDEGGADGAAGVVLSARIRGIVAGAVEEALQRLGHALGPALLTQDEEHARRVADLEVYLRQHHAERDDAALGRQLLTGGTPW